MSQVKALKVLVRVRQREAARIEERLAEQSRQMAHCQDELAQGRDARVESLRREQQQLEARSALISGPFTADALKTMDFAVQDRRQELADADKALRTKEEAVKSCDKVLALTRAEQRRNQQRIESFEERVALLLREGEQAIEEAAEEETTETAAARISARNRR